jgi:cysteine-rich repeat protein
MRRHLPFLSLSIAACAVDPAKNGGTTTDETGGETQESGQPPETGETDTPGCGDGIRDPLEECDDGPENSDTLADHCRTNCLLPRCGDAVADTGEACDDGSAWGGDGCTPACLAETGTLEVEPNDAWSSPWVVTPGLLHGSLTEGDQDCLGLRLDACSAIELREAEPCGGAFGVSLYRPDGALVAVGNPRDDGCTHLDPLFAEGARFLEEGPWALCLRPLRGDTVPAWAAELTVYPEGSLAIELPAEQDIDQDGRPPACDPDDDGDGISDTEDDCPEVPQGGGAGVIRTGSSGFIHHFLAAGPFTGTTSAASCRPSDVELLDGVSDAAHVPVLGSPAGSFTWRTLISPSDRIELLTDFGGVGAPREVYLSVWIKSPIARDARVAIGPDDGARIWFDGIEVLEVDSCQGTNVDQFGADISLSGEFQLLTVKIRDQGGGWGTYLRLLDADGAPLSDLELALVADGSALPLGDADGDGVGDACDPDPGL